jgi:predicted Zn finger-like uncharacterized protein
MLLTTCPKCAAQFKVSTDQLNLRSGRVMCGRCRHVFNAFESLERVDSTFGEFDVFSEKEAPAPPASKPTQPALAENAAVLEYDPDFVAGPKSVPYDDPVSMPGPISEPFSQPLANPVSTPAIDSPPSLPPAFLQSGFGDESIPAGNAQAPYKYAPITPSAPPVSPPSKAWGFLAFLAGVALAAQVLYMWRSELVSRYPDLRPYFASACDAIGCTLPWGRNQSALKVEASDLIEELNRRGRFLLTATIANRAPAVQDYPHLELSLTDTGNQTLVRRVLAPAQYLGRPLERGEGMASNSVTQINVRLESTAANAAGYHVELFYP